MDKISRASFFTRFRMEMIALLDQFRQGDRRRGTWRRDIARRSNWEGKKEGRREDRLEATVFHRARRGFLNEERSFGSLIYTAAKLKRMRRPGPRLQISAGSSARRRVSHARKKRTRIPRGKERGDYIVIREECWLDPSAGRVLALLPSPEPSWNSLSLFPPLSLSSSLLRVPFRPRESVWTSWAHEFTETRVKLCSARIIYFSRTKLYSNAVCSGQRLGFLGFPSNLVIRIR